MTRDEHMNPIDDGAPPGEPVAPAPSASEQRPPRLVSRRALVRAGWTVPVVLALHLPVNAWAFTPAPSDPPPHSDVAAAAHSDTAATLHVDTPLPTHVDTPPSAHADVPATAHVDA